MEQQLEQRPNQQKKGESLCSFIIYLTFTIFFGIYTNDPSYYHPCSTSSSIYHWSLITFYCLISSFVIYGLLVPILVCCMASGSETGTMACGCFIIISRIAAMVLSFVCYGGLIYAYGKDENCGSLSKLALAYIIVISVAVGIMVFAIVCICCCLGLGSVIGVEQRNNGQIGNPGRFSNFQEERV